MTRIERNRAYLEAKSEVEAEITKARTARNDAFKSYFSHPNQPDRKTQLDKANKTIDELLQKKSLLGATSLKNTLSRIRSMGIENESVVKAHLRNGTSPMLQYVMNAYDYYPSAWIDKSVTAGNISVRQVKNRGYYDKKEHRIGIGTNIPSKLGTAIYELAHRFEETVPGLFEEEKRFYDTRTFMCPLERLCDLDPDGKYLTKEKTRQDKFINPYIGKDYQGNAYELTSVGVQYALTDPSLLATDPEYEAWILGLLTLL